MSKASFIKEAKKDLYSEKGYFACANVLYEAVQGLCTSQLSVAFELFTDCRRVKQIFTVKEENSISDLLLYILQILGQLKEIHMEFSSDVLNTDFGIPRAVL